MRSGADLQSAFLSEHRDESVGVTVPDLVIFFEPRDLAHVRRVEHIGLQQSHPIIDRVAVLLFDRREVTLRSLDFLGHARCSLAAIEEEFQIIEIGLHSRLGLPFGKFAVLGNMSDHLRMVSSW